jgi:SAM-dependent methyltransferase
MSTRARVATGLGLALAAGIAWQRVHPSACPYSQRWLLDVPRPWLTVERLTDVLEPRPGERILEVGPGTGHFALPVARAILPGGVLAGLDLQQEMLDEVSLRAGERQVENVELRQGDATALPYDASSFDAAYLVTVLGEIPDQAAALRELRRVLRPGGRLVFGETVLDPHLVTPSSLVERAEAAGFIYERTSGAPPWGFFARFANP